MENVKQGHEKKKGFGAKFMTFLMSGGIIVVLIAGLAIMVIVNKLMH
jgi:hypothetical protein